jgi:Ca2+-binding RTX toxin-like protein
MANITATNYLTFGTEENDSIAGRDQEDLIFAGGGDDLVAGMGGDDYVQGDSGNDSIFGFAGNDSIFGGEGNDTILGLDDNDTLSGGNGNDVIMGGNGMDRLIGNEGSDHLFGEGYGADTGGADTFLFNFGGGFGFVGQPSQGIDLIEGFGRGIDVIQVAGLDENLDTNRNGFLDDADERVDATSVYANIGPMLTIDFNGVSLIDGDTATGVLIVSGIAELGVGSDIFFM